MTVSESYIKTLHSSKFLHRTVCCEELVSYTTTACDYKLFSSCCVHTIGFQSTLSGAWVVYLTSWLTTDILRDF